MNMRKRIRNYIDLNGLKLNHVAKMSDIDVKRFYNLMSGTTRITFEDYANICRGLGVGPEYFFEQSFLESKKIKEKAVF